MTDHDRQQAEGDAGNGLIAEIQRDPRQDPRQRDGQHELRTIRLATEEPEPMHGERGQRSEQEREDLSRSWRRSASSPEL